MKYGALSYRWVTRRIISLETRYVFVQIYYQRNVPKATIDGVYLGINLHFLEVCPFGLGVTLQIHFFIQPFFSNPKFDENFQWIKSTPNRTGSRTPEQADRTPEGQRHKARKMLRDILTQRSHNSDLKMDLQSITRLVAKIEKSLYQKYQQPNKQYMVRHSLWWFCFKKFNFYILGKI